MEPLLFEPGRLFTTPGVMDRISGEDALLCLLRHLSGDWGDLDPEDKAANAEALRYGNRLLSAYKVSGTKVWVITEADRSVTTLLLPEEY